MSSASAARSDRRTYASPLMIGRTVRATDILGRVQARVRLLRATSLSQPGRRLQVVAEIRALVEAIAARDAGRATELCDAHLHEAAASGVTALSGDPAT
ncbi:FCD domain-containing protein [Actinomadura sp. B10D3]|uniref:FCD domain-containing protein n=1 Tax=Actinomadura sp. B10D3 TaxID=3153557 RepID=UPI00325C6785